MDHPTIPTVETTVIDCELQTLGSDVLYDAVITAETWPILSREIKDRIEMDLASKGYRLNQCWSVQYTSGLLHRITVVAF